jgi:hypothetical protein
MPARSPSAHAPGCGTCCAPPARAGLHPNPLALTRGISGALGGGKKTADIQKNPIAEANPSPNPGPSPSPNHNPSPNPNPSPDPNPNPNPNQAGSLVAFVIVISAIVFGGLVRVRVRVRVRVKG